MKPIKYILLFSFFFFLFSLKSQNLVINPSFEYHYTLNYPFTSQLDTIIVDWTYPINFFNSADYFHVNAISSNFQIPLNVVGNQDTCHQQAYAGLFNFSTHGIVTDYHGREYLTGSLDTNLITNQCYKVSFKYSLGDAVSQVATSNFGIYFSNSIPINNAVGNNLNTLNYTPQIIVNQWMNDRVNWIKIERYFVAQGGEKYFTLGNFFDNNNTPTQFVKNGFNSLGGKSSYVYLDDIHVEAVPTLSLPQLNLGADTILCNGEELEFDSLLPNNPVYVWNNLVESSDSSFTIDSTGTYWVEAYNGCSYTSDTINVQYTEIEVDLGNDTTLCKRQELLLQANYTHPQVEYLWSTNETTQQIIVSDSGKYWLQSRVERCTDTDSVYIEYHIPENSTLIQQNVDTTLCVNGILDAGSSDWNDTYYWSTMPTGRQADATIQTIEITQSGIYKVAIENECTEAFSTFDVTVEQLEEGLNPINIFTPNGDGYNDLFTIYTGNSEEYNLEIYNRWGKLIWKTNTLQIYWNGSDVSDGVYYYSLSFVNCANEVVERKGTVQVLR